MVSDIKRFGILHLFRVSELFLSDIKKTNHHFFTIKPVDRFREVIDLRVLVINRNFSTKMVKAKVVHNDLQKEKRFFSNLNSNPKLEKIYFFSAKNRDFCDK